MADPASFSPTCQARVPLYGNPDSRRFQSQREFQTITEGISGEVVAMAKTHESIAICFYSRAPKNRAIETVYATYGSQLSAHATSIAKNETCVNQQYEQLAGLKDKKIVATEWLKLSRLAVQLYLLKIRNSDLLLLFTSPMYRDALRFYKEKTRAVIEQKKYAVISQIHEEVTASLERLSQTAPIGDEIRRLYKELLQFCLYALKNISEETTALQADIETSLQKCDDQDLLMTKQMNALTINEPLPSSCTPDYFKNVQLRTERCFKGSLYFLSKRYPAIYDSIKKLEEIAKGLQKMESDLEESVMQAIHGNFKYIPIIETVNEFEQQLGEEQKKLYTIDFASADQVREAVPYVASLFSWIHEIRNTHSILSDITTNYTKVGLAQQALMYYLNPVEFSDLNQSATMSITHLCKTICAAESLTGCPDPQSFAETWEKRTIKVIKDIINHFGPTTLVLTPGEQALLVSEVGKRKLSTNENGISNALQSLIEKRIGEILYFSNKLYDPELDLLLESLTSTNQLSKDSDFQEIYSTYKVQTKLEKDFDLLEGFNEIFRLLNLAQNTSMPEYRDFLIYFRCRQRLLDMSEMRLGEYSQYRYNWFIKKMEAELLKIKQRNNFPKSFDDLEKIDGNSSNDEILFKHLLAAIWSKNEKKRNFAIGEIYKLWASIGNRHLNSHLQQLIYEFLLCVHHNQDDRFRNEYINLSPFFTDYLTNVMVTKFWRQWHSTRFMETALHTVIQIDTKVKEWFTIWRAKNLYDAWFTAVSDYKKFTSLMNTPETEARNTEARNNECKQLVSNLEKQINDPLIKSDSSYFLVIQDCYTCMNKHLQKIEPKKET